MKPWCIPIAQFAIVKLFGQPANDNYTSAISITYLFRDVLSLTKVSVSHNFVEFSNSLWDAE